MVSPFVFGGRPRGRNVDSRPSCFAVASCQDSDPKGRPRRTDVDTASRSFFVKARFTRASQFAERELAKGKGWTGPSSRTGGVRATDCSNATARIARPSSVGRRCVRRTATQRKDGRPPQWETICRSPSKDGRSRPSDVADASDAHASSSIAA